MNRVIAVSCLFDFVSGGKKGDSRSTLFDPYVFFFFFFQSGYSIFRPLVAGREGGTRVSRVKYDPLAGCYEFFFSLDFRVAFLGEVSKSPFFCGSRREWLISTPRILLIISGCPIGFFRFIR